MDIPNSRFPQEVVRIIQEVAESHFIALDLEFSGVASRRSVQNSGGKPSLQEYYDYVKAAAEKYQVLQVGLTIVKEDLTKDVHNLSAIRELLNLWRCFSILDRGPGDVAYQHLLAVLTDAGCYIARPYNFHLNPLPSLKEQHFHREWSFHSGAISFLIRNGFKFDLPLTQGIPYLSRKEERQARQNMAEDDEIRARIPDMKLKDEDAFLIEHIRDSIDKWQSLPKRHQDSFLNIPAEDASATVPTKLTRYQVRLTHQVVRNQYPHLLTQGMGHFVQITNPTAEQQTHEKEFREKMREREISKAIGFRWLVEAIVGGDISGLHPDYLKPALPSKAEGETPMQALHNKLKAELKSVPKVLVGHNCFTDLINFYKCFIGDLPVRVEEFTSKVHQLFPIVLDTKYMASLGNKRWGDTSLQFVEEELRTEPLPKIRVPTEFNRYENVTSYHEAGYDSLITAKIAIKLSAKLKREGKDMKYAAAAKAGGQTQAEVAVDESEYETAAESVPEEDANERGFPTTVTKVLKAPVATVPMLMTSSNRGQGSGNESTLSKAGHKAPETAAIDGGDGSNVPGVLVVQPTAKPVASSKEMNFKKIKSAALKANIYDILEYDSPSDLTPPVVVDQSDNLEVMVQKGIVMPRYREREFWKVFGNKLQVNACQEGICEL